MSRLEEIDRQIASLLDNSRTATIATVDEHGRPHAANIQYVHDDRRRLCFVSSPDSAHSRHVARTGCVAMTIYAHEDNRPDQIHGLQLHGDCQPLTDPNDRQRAWDLYLRKYTFLAQCAELQRAVEDLQNGTFIKP